MDCGLSAKEMKILIIANSIVGEMPGLSGGDIRFIEIAKNWAKKGYEIHLLSSKGGERLCQRLGLEVKLHCLSRSSRTNRLAFFHIFLKSLVLPRTLWGFDEGIVYCASEQIYDVLPGVWLKFRSPKKIRLAVVVHWLPPAKWWRRKESSFLNSLLFLLSERSGLCLAGFFADRLLPVSESTGRQIEKSVLGRVFSKKSFAVKCGVNFEKIRQTVAAVSQRKYEAVFMKRIQAVKGIFDLVEIWKMVTKKVPSAKLIVIGSGVDEEAAKRMVEKEGLSNNIQFLGAIYDEVGKFKKIAEAKLFLLPSYEENWAIVIGEAMAVGIPVIAYGLSELKEVWGDNFVAVPVGDKKDFVEKILHFLSDQSAREELVARALDFIKDYEWKVVAKEELEAILK